MDQRVRIGYLVGSFFVVAAMQFCFAGSQEELFLRGNKHYQDGNYAQALESYEAIKRPGSACWYNMGNCLYHTERYVDAILYWRRAEHGARCGEYQHIDHNYLQAYEKLSKEYPNGTSCVMRRFFRRTINGISLCVWQMIFLLLWLAACIALPIFARARSWWKIIILLLTLLSVTVCMLCHVHFQEQNYVIVTQADAELRAGPGEDFAVVDPVGLAEECRVKTVQDEWLKIKCLSGIGWIQLTDVGFVDPEMNKNE